MSDKSTYMYIIGNRKEIFMGQVMIKNNGNALTVALVLAVTAPTEEQSKEAERMAQQIASGMTAKEVDLSKKAAEVVLEFQQGA